jgi:hypothetical protein
MSEKYVPVFVPIVKETTLKIDLNYFSIRQKMKKYGMNTFKSIRQTNKETGDSLTKYYEEMNLCILNFYKFVREKYGNKKES